MSFCSRVPAQAKADAGVAGPGVMLLFIMTALVTLALSVSMVAMEYFKKTKEKAKVLRKLLGGLIHQQLVTGIIVQAIGMGLMHVLVPYHFFIVWMYGLLSIVPPMAAMVALNDEHRIDRVLR
jgi:hypothetical protein